MPSRTTRRSTKGASKKFRSTLSVKDFRSKFNELDKSMRNFIKSSKITNPSALVKEVSRYWSKLFKKNLSGKAANNLASHYFNIYGKKSKKGGSLSGAPLDYVMRPGMPSVATYGVFPTEAGADVKASGHLDVYYNSAIGRGCGTENTTAVVPKDMGSNLVNPVKGGSRKTRRFRSKGGNFMTTLSTRIPMSSSPAGPIQIGYERMMGQPAFVRDTHDPSSHKWGLVSDGSVPVNPHGITMIEKSASVLANPSPYPSK
jgi:hypothetical protein